jgi:acetyltransferase-like isoleucine patch superfamily enzyme
MRKINFSQIAVFSFLCAVILFLGIGASAVIFGNLSLGDYRSLITILFSILFIYFFAFLVYRFFLTLFQLKEGEIAENSMQEFGYHVYLLFYLIFFYPLMRSGFIPLPIMRIVYIVLGARLGTNTFSSGIILDPPFVEVGSNTLIGQFSLLIPHVIEGKRLAHYRIKIGNNVTIGAHAVVMSGVIIGDNSIIATSAVVTKGTNIGVGEVWGGVPAKKLKDLQELANSPHLK